MKIQLLNNMKLHNGMVMRKGIYDDSVQKFPNEIYDEIELCRQKKAFTVKILEENTTAKKKQEKNVITTMDEGTQAVQTDSGEAQAPSVDIEAAQKEAPAEKPKRKPSRKKKKTSEEG